MAYGPRLCACCGATDGVEKHHLYLRSEGCPDDLTVWLCHVCHGRAHGMQRRINISARTKAALAAARERGVRLGSPKKPSLEQSRAAAVHAAKARAAKADSRATAYAATIGAIQAEGISSSTGIASALTKRAVPLPSGALGAWQAVQVQRLLRRLGPLA